MGLLGSGASTTRFYIIYIYIYLFFLEIIYLFIFIVIYCDRQTMLYT